MFLKGLVPTPFSRVNVGETTDSQWTLSFVEHGAYNITSNTGPWLTVGVRNALVTGRRGTTWTFDARGDAFVYAFTPHRLHYLVTNQGRVGKAVNATAILACTESSKCKPVNVQKTELISLTLVFYRTWVSVFPRGAGVIY